MNTHDKIELPPLPEDLIAQTMLATEVRSLLRRYGERCWNAAIEADRQRRGESVPKGWKLVPETPTSKQIVHMACQIKGADADGWFRTDGDDWPEHVAAAERAYKWALSEAPQPAEPCASSVSNKTACGSENGNCDSQPAEPEQHATLNLQPSSSMQPVATAFFTEKGEVAFTGLFDRTLKALEAVKTTRMGISSGSIDLYTAPQPTEPVSVPKHLIERLQKHCEDKSNTAFSRSTMREALQYLTVEPVKCVGCEGKPAPENNPCAVCGKEAESVGGLSSEQLAEILTAYITPEIIREALKKLENAPWELSSPVEVPNALPSGKNYSVEPHGNGYAIYQGRDKLHHGANLAHLTECTPEFSKRIESALNEMSEPLKVPSDETRGEIAVAIQAQNRHTDLPTVRFWVDTVCNEIARYGSKTGEATKQQREIAE